MIEFNVVATEGSHVRLTFGRSLFSNLIHASTFEAGLPQLIRRATVIKHAIDYEISSGAMPSIALNRLVETAGRIQANLSTIVEEIKLKLFGENLQKIVDIHTGVGKGLPSDELQHVVIRAWLRSPDLS